MLKHGNAAVYFSNYLLLSCLEEKKSSGGLCLVCWWCLGALGTDICSLSVRKWIPLSRAFTNCSWSDSRAPPCGLCRQCRHVLEWLIGLMLHTVFHNTDLIFLWFLFVLVMSLYFYTCISSNITVWIHCMFCGTSVTYVHFTILESGKIALTILTRRIHSLMCISMLFLTLHFCPSTFLYLILSFFCTSVILAQFLKLCFPAFHLI